jgi:predicted nucleic acid-binding protein
MAIAVEVDPFRDDFSRLEWLAGPGRHAIRRHHHCLPNPQMTQPRATFSLDSATMDGIRLLARRWNTSQAGVVRRAVAEAVRELQALPSVQQAVQQYRAGEIDRDEQEVRVLAAALRLERQQEAAARAASAAGPVIHFDTNVLIALPVWARQGHPVIARLEQGVAASVCSLVWCEFVSGPVSEQEVHLARAVLQNRIAEVSATDAELRLFNLTGRRRSLKTETLIAACAINAGAVFVTLNHADFEPFCAHGLRLLATA